MLTNQQAAIVDHLRRVKSNGYIHPKTPLEQKLAPQLLPLVNVDSESYGGTPDQLAAYYAALNAARHAI